MNDEIRAALVARLEEKGMSRADLARAVGKHPNAITRALNGLPDGGRVPELWAAMLDAVDARLTVTPGRVAEGQAVPPPARAKPGRKPTKTGEGERRPLIESTPYAARTRGNPAHPATASGAGQVEHRHEDTGGNHAGETESGPDIDAAPLFDMNEDAGQADPASSSPVPDRLIFARGVLAPSNLSGTARRVLEDVAAGGTLARVGDAWQLEDLAGQVRRVDRRTVARLQAVGVLATRGEEKRPAGQRDALEEWGEM